MDNGHCKLFSYPFHSFSFCYSHQSSNQRSSTLPSCLKYSNILLWVLRGKLNPLCNALSPKSQHNGDLNTTALNDNRCSGLQSMISHLCHGMGVGHTISH